MERANQKQTVTLKRGLFLVRYAGAEDSARPPAVRVSPEPAPNKNLGFLLHPDHDTAVLWQPDTCLVVRALAPATLSVEVIPAQEGGSVAATVRIETLTQGNPTAPSAQPKGRGSVPHDLSNFRILAHITGIGDRVVNANQWIAGPAAPSRIEGIALEWPDKPAGLEIRYAVKTAKPQAVSGRPMGLGAFAGTRGKAMPIVGLMLEIAGPEAADFQFSVEAIFLGSPAKHMIGKRVIASGLTGREPLVGLRLGLENCQAAAQKPLAKTPATAPKQSKGRTRVFRSRSQPTEQESV